MTVTCDLVVVNSGEDKVLVIGGPESQMVDNFGNVYPIRDFRLGNSQGQTGIPVISGVPVSLRVTFENVTLEAVSIAKLAIQGGWQGGVYYGFHHIKVEFRGVPLGR
jgi:hypothetical protein